MADLHPKLRETVEVATEMVIAGSATVIGGVVAGLPGAMLGAGLGQCLRDVGREICERTLGPREEYRVGEVFRMLSEGIKRRLDAGEKPREDGVFNPILHGRSKAQEVAEGTLLLVQRSYEERKLPYLAKFLENFAFDADLDPATSNALHSLAETLSFRQFCLLEFATSTLKNELRRVTIASLYVGDDKSFSVPHLAVLTECFDLYKRNLVRFPIGPNNFTEMVLFDMSLTGLGPVFCKSFGLGKISRFELSELKSQLLP